MKAKMSAMTCLIHVESFNAWLAKRCQARIGE
nr:MAG TPA: hypothetical protein [Caudoviricetes sp.]